MNKRLRLPGFAGLTGTVLALLAASLPASAASGAAGITSARALLVCNGSTVTCPSGSFYQTIQAAVDAAHPGDWVLIWPGVYHEKSAQWPTAGVWIQTPDVHVRGLDRNGVIIDGSNGTASHPCPSDPSLQDTNGGAGRNGIEVYKASGVTIQNLTVCDYLTGTGNAGNEIWWNGGDGSGKIGMGAYQGSYLTATSMYAPTDIHSPNLAQYGIFVSNAGGPGSITESYASNMADAAYYVGACQRRCNTTLAHDTGTSSALGYSGTNAGGNLVITNSLFYNNRTGLAPNSLNNDDAPPPQDGRCPGAATKSCLIIEHNVITANNNPNAPNSGLTPAIGTGVEISGGAYDTVRQNQITGNGSWGVVTHDYPDTETPPAGSHCQGGIQLSPTLCLFPAHGNRVYLNEFGGNGFFGNPTNGDLATVGLLPTSATPRNCFFSNHDVSGLLTSEPAGIQRSSVDGRPCDQQGTSLDGALVGQLICATGATGLGNCPAGSHYPKQTKIVMAPLPTLPVMPDPCLGVPGNVFCPRR
ncbi:MAG TPA: hypothetical protein VGS62_02995 [Streptosporangiaceae bacterium]|nr:hypothetical protein [Streptosporangiaceae bacterium]